MKNLYADLSKRDIKYFKSCCIVAKIVSNTRLPLMRVQDLAAVLYGFESFDDLLKHPCDLIVSYDFKLDVPVIMEAIDNA